MDEPTLDPDLPVCDAHHHIMRDFQGKRYLLDDLLADVGSGHRVLTSVYAECHSGYRTDGPEHLRPVGETEYVASLAAPPGIMGAIVGAADFLLGDAVGEVLDAHLAAAPDRFRGVRFPTAWDPAPGFSGNRRPGMLVEPSARRAIAAMGERGLVTDCWLYWPQLDEMAAVAQAFPEQIFVLDHLGGPLMVGHHLDHRDEAEAGWRTKLSAVATCPNVMLKIGGLGMVRFGIPWSPASRVASCAEFADHWRERVEWCIDVFGPDRCMFESNFPVDGLVIDYPTIWNAFKLLARSYTDSERAMLVRGTAERVYIPVTAGHPSP